MKATKKSTVTLTMTTEEAELLQVILSGIISETNSAMSQFINEAHECIDDALGDDYFVDAFDDHFKLEEGLVICR